MRWREHLILDKALLGKEYTVIHILKDLPAIWLHKKHREALHYDMKSNLLIALIASQLYGLDFRKALLACLLHDLADKDPSKALFLALLRKYMYR